MPLSIDLPDGLKGLAIRNGLELIDTHFRVDVDRLIEALESPIPEQVAASVFVGRDREIGELRTALQAALSGQGGW